MTGAEYLFENWSLSWQGGLFVIFHKCKIGWISNSLENDRNLHEVIDCLWQVHSVKYKLDSQTFCWHMYT